MDEEFFTRAKNFAAKASANGVSNMAINNFINARFAEYEAQKKMELEQSKFSWQKKMDERDSTDSQYIYVDVDGDGKLERLDKDTGEVVQEYGDTGSGSLAGMEEAGPITSLDQVANQFIAPSDVPTTVPQTKGDLDLTMQNILGNLNLPENIDLSRSTGEKSDWSDNLSIPMTIKK